jgi:hypothetical protein
MMARYCLGALLIGCAATFGCALRPLDPGEDPNAPESLSEATQALDPAQAAFAVGGGYAAGSVRRAVGADTPIGQHINLQYAASSNPAAQDPEGAQDSKPGSPAGAKPGPSPWDESAPDPDEDGSQPGPTPWALRKGGKPGPSPWAAQATNPSVVSD